MSNYRIVPVTKQGKPIGKQLLVRGDLIVGDLYLTKDQLEEVERLLCSEKEAEYCQCDSRYVKEDGNCAHCGLEI